MADFALINLVASQVFVFQFFPARIEVSRKINWAEQDTTIGVKPLFYANQDGARITADNLYLDNSDINQSVGDQLVELLKFTDEIAERGTPPPFLAVWGGKQERVVLEEINITEEFFNADGDPVRVKIRLTMREIQPDDQESTGVQT